VTTTTIVSGKRPWIKPPGVVFASYGAFQFRILSWRICELEHELEELDASSMTGGGFRHFTPSLSRLTGTLEIKPDPLPLPWIDGYGPLRIRRNLDPIVDLSISRIPPTQVVSRQSMLFPLYLTQNGLASLYALGLINDLG
jgi:hypothetical protein